MTLGQVKRNSYVEWDLGSRQLARQRLHNDENKLFNSTRQRLLGVQRYQKKKIADIAVGYWSMSLGFKEKHSGAAQRKELGRRMDVCT